MSDKRPILLLVEDELTHRRLFERNFERTEVPMELVAAESGVQAMQYLYQYAETSTTPLVMVLDLKMLGMNGIQVLETVRNDVRLAHIPVIVLTTSDEEEEIERCHELGAINYLIKPVNFDELTIYIEHALATYVA